MAGVKSMKEMKLGLQLHAVREGFAEDPLGTLRRVAAMGYEGVECNIFAMNREIQVYEEALAETGLACFGCLASWNDLQPEALEKTMRYLKALKTQTLVIGNVDFQKLQSEADYPQKAVEHMKKVADVMRQEGIATGYHSHDGDFQHLVEGKPFYEWVFQQMPEDFLMVLDTGNIQGGGADPLEMIRKFPGRTSTAHIKGYSQAKGYVTPVWESELDWEAFFPLLLEEGGAQIIDVEFGMRGDYEPFERAELSLKWLKEQTV